MVCKSNLAFVFIPDVTRLSLDLYGRGFSDGPSTTYDSALYTTQLALLLQYLGWQSANIVGVSMASSLDSHSPTIP
jgi:pimeloyl-ACP methyl ester carboxylesterase